MGMGRSMTCLRRRAARLTGRPPTEAQWLIPGVGCTDLPQASQQEHITGQSLNGSE